MPISKSVYLSDEAQKHLEYLAGAANESQSQIVCRCVLRTTLPDLLGDMVAELEARREETKEGKN